MININNFILIWLFIIGLCLGSFYNVVILRSISGESIVFPPSKCPKCGKKLKPWHNIPILSYIFLHGKCAFCKEKISIQYPIVEFLTGVVFCTLFLKFGLSYKLLFALFWCSCLIIMTVTDIKEKLVDCNYAIVIAISGLIYSYLTFGLIGIKDSLLAGLLGFAAIELVARFGYLFKKGRAMGEADSYVAAAFGAIAGCSGIWRILLYSLFASMLFIVPVFLYSRFKAKDKLSLVFFVLFTLGIILTKLYPASIGALLFLLWTGLGLALYTIKGMNAESDLNLLPFVPAMAMGFLYYLFTL